MSQSQAAALGMLSPAAGVAAMANLLADLSFATSPRAAGTTLHSGKSRASLFCFTIRNGKQTSAVQLADH